jgi:FAD-dependent urate hydroxylase
MRTITIIGSGPTGLFLASQLQKLGMKVAIMEQAPGPRHEGGGLCLWTPAVALLESAGFGESLQKLSSHADAINMTAVGATLVNHIPADTFKQISGHQNAYVARSELQEMLAQPVQDCIQFNKKLTHFEQNDNGVTAYFADGTQVTSDILIGADGAYSKVRRELNNNQPLEYQGYIALGGIVECGTLPHQYITALNRTAIFMPIANNRHYIFMIRPLPENQIKFIYANPQDQINLFVGWSDAADKMLALLEKTLATPNTAQHYFCKEIYCNNTNTNYYQNRVVVVGEAAHPSSPILGLGAMIGFQGVMSLVKALEKNPTQLEQAFQYYQQVQQARIGKLFPLEKSEITTLLNTDKNAFEAHIEILGKYTAAQLYAGMIQTLIDCSDDEKLYQEAQIKSKALSFV